VILACRSEARAQPVVDAIRAETGNDEVRFVPLDLASLASVQACAQQLLHEEPAIHVLINNAGIAGIQGQTEEGFELAFGVNHMGHFLLTKLLLPRIKASGGGRIVNVASRAHYRAKGLDWSRVNGTTRSFTAVEEYNTSKLANVLFTKELARQLKGSNVTTYSLHPGVVGSSIWKRVPWGIRHLMKLFMISNEEGALTTLHCALSPQAGKESGLYYDKRQPREPSKAAQDDALAKELWEKSEKWVQRFSYVEDNTPPPAEDAVAAEDAVVAEESPAPLTESITDEKSINIEPTPDEAATHKADPSPMTEKDAAIVPGPVEKHPDAAPLTESVTDEKSIDVPPPEIDPEETPDSDATDDGAKEEAEAKESGDSEGSEEKAEAKESGDSEGSSPH